MFCFRAQHFVKLAASFCFSGQVEGLRWLLGCEDSEGASGVDVRSDDAGAQLWEKTSDSNKQCVRSVLDAVHVFCKARDPLGGGRLPLHVAALCGKPGPLFFMLFAAAWSSGEGKDICSVVDSLTTADGATVLHLSCFAGVVPLCERLVVLSPPLLYQRCALLPLLCPRLRFTC